MKKRGNEGERPEDSGRAKGSKGNGGNGNGGGNGGGDTGEALSVVIQANAVLAQGMAKAFSKGFEALNHALQNGDMTEPGLDNPLLKGSLAGSLKAMDTSLESIRKAVRILFAPN